MPQAAPPPPRPRSGEPPLLRLEAARLGYGSRAVLAGIDLAIAPRAFLAVLGPNGAGKTTLVRALLGRLAPLAGRLERRPGLAIGYVPQGQALDRIWPLRVRDLVAGGTLDLARPGAWRRLSALGGAGRAGAAERRRVERALDDLGLLALADRPFRELSGGQQQRAVLARALVREPDVLILDEPTAMLDVAAAADALALAARLHRERAVAVVLVTHDLGAAAEHATDLAVVAGGAVRCGSAQDLFASGELSALFGVPLAVVDAGGRRVVVAGTRAGAAEPPP